MTSQATVRAPGAGTPDATSLREAITLFFAGYTGRDPYLAQRLAYWADALGDRPIATLTPDEIESALLALRRRGATHNVGGRLLFTGRPLAPATLNRYLNSLLTLWKGCQKAGLVSRSLRCPAKGFGEREDEGRMRYLTREEFDRLRHWCRRSCWPRLEAFVVLATTTALRVGSLRSLRWRDVNLKAGTITVQYTKNGKPQISVIAPIAHELLVRLPGPKEPDHLVFRGKHADKPHEFRKAWEAARARAGLDDGQVCLHTLRHTAASWAAQAGHNPLEISQLTGHKSLVSLRRYTHLDTTNLRKLSAGVFGNL